jgi:hypothetical protein
MPAIDVHGKYLVEALADIVRLYNEQARPEKGRVLRVVHGYGSTGKGGVIRHALRAYLIARNIDFRTGEEVERNPGVTLITLGSKPIADGFLMSPLRKQSKPYENNVALFAELQQQFEQEKERWLKEREAEQQRLSGRLFQSQQEKAELEKRLKERENEMSRLAGEVQNLEQQQAELEQQSNELRRLRDNLEAERVALAKSAPGTQDPGLEDRIEALDRKDKELESQRGEVLQFRKRLLAARDELADQKTRVEQDLRQRTEAINQFAGRMTQLEKENQRLKDELKKAAQDLSRRAAPPRKRLWALAGIVLALIIIIILFLALRDRPPAPDPNPPPDAPGNPGKPPDPATQPPARIIKPADAAAWEGKEVTVEFVVGSTHDGLDWAFVVNSEPDFRDPKNFEVLVERKTAGKKYEARKIASLSEYFKRGSVIRVTGKIEKYKDKRSGKEHYQIRVKDPDQIQRR